MVELDWKSTKLSLFAGFWWPFKVPWWRLTVPIRCAVDSVSDVGPPLIVRPLLWRRRRRRRLTRRTGTSRLSAAATADADADRSAPFQHLGRRESRHKSSSPPVQRIAIVIGSDPAQPIGRDRSTRRISWKKNKKTNKTKQNEIKDEQRR